MTTKTAMRFPPVETSLPIVPSPDAVPLTEPVIDWTKLSSPVESTTQKACRSFGQFLIIVSIFSGVARYFAATHLTASPDTIINTCYTLRVIMIVSAVAGVVLWFFNRLTDDPHALLQKRGQVKELMGTVCLADLRRAYNHLVVSNHELNQWIRYLVQKSPFNEFIRLQSEQVFDLDLEEETITLLKDRYLAYVQTTAMNIKKLIGEKAFQVLLSKEEQDNLKRLVANREASKLKILNAAAYQLFIRENGIEVLQYLDPILRENLAPAFRDHALQSGMGILQLKKDRAAELSVFGEQTALFLDMANGEGTQPYVTFKARNGVEAVDLITNPPVREALWQSFFAHVVGKGLGLVETRQTFGGEIARFGEGAPQAIYTQVLQNETNALGSGQRNYLQFRQRNGVDVIQFNAYGNFDLTRFFKECFLRLPATDFVNPAFAVDRSLLGISAADVRSVLVERWMGMTFANILAIDRDGFISSVSGDTWCFGPREWTQKAVQETSTLRIQEVITTYGVLFTTGVLTAADGNFSARLSTEIQSMTEWTTFVDSYGMFVFEQGLLQPSQVQNLVHRFVSVHAESFLQGRFDAGIKKYADVIQRFCMDPALARKIAEAKGAITSENQSYGNWIKLHEGAYGLRVKALNEETERTIASLESTYNLPQRERDKNKAHQQWVEKKAAYAALAERQSADDAEIEKTKKTISEKRALQLGLVEEKKQLLGLNITGNSAHYSHQAQLAQTALRTAENYVGGCCFTVEGFLERFQLQEKKLGETIQKLEKLQNEHAQLAKKVQDRAFAERKAQLEKRIKNPGQPVTGLEAAKKAKKEVAEAPALLAEMNAEEERFDELKKLLTPPDNQLASFKISHAQIKALIEQKQEEARQIRSAAEAQVQLPLRRQEESQASQAAIQWKAKADELQSVLQQIDNLSIEIERLRSNLERKTGAQNEKERQLESSLRQVELAKSTKDGEELSFNTFAQRLAEQTTEARQKCSRDVAAVLSEKEQLRKQADSAHTQNLSHIVLTFRQQI